MERKYLIVLMLLGIMAGLYAAITYQWVLMVLVVALVALILVAADVLQRVRLLSEAIATSMANLEESVASMRCTVERIEQRLGDLENRWGLIWRGSRNASKWVENILPRSHLRCSSLDHGCAVVSSTACMG